MSVSAQPSVANLEALLFKATNPANKIEDVNTIKRFCDAVVDALPEGAAVACRLLAHKIQSPQEREALQALAVLEACVKACGEDFHAEVGKFRFLNEMIKLVSPRYLGSRTPEHIKKKVIELLYLWTRELRSETKISEAYSMLKAQGIVRQDPDYVGSAVFAASLPPRRQEDSPLTREQNRQLKTLLQSRNPEDLQRANKIIKGIMKEDERKMDEMTRRSSDLVTANNNAKLLSEMLDHFDRGTSGAEELELLKELFEACEKMQPKLFRLASDTEDGDESIAEILQTSDDISRVMDRYRTVVKQGRPDVTRASSQQQPPPSYSEARAPPAPRRAPPPQDPLEQLLDLGDIPAPLPRRSDAPPSPPSPPSAAAAAAASATGTSSAPSATADDDILGLMSGLSTASAVNTIPVSDKQNGQTEASALAVLPADVLQASSSSTIAPPPQQQQQPTVSVDDLLTNGSPVGGGDSSAVLITSLLSSASSKSSSAPSPFEQRMEGARDSRRRGLEELDLLGESAIKTHLSGTERSPQFEARRVEKMPIAKLQEQQKQAQAQALTRALQPGAESTSPKPPGMPVPVAATKEAPKPGGAARRVSEETKSEDQSHSITSPGASSSEKPAVPPSTVSSSPAAANEPPKDKSDSSSPVPEVKLADLEVPLSSIQPGSVPPLTVTGEDDDSAVSIVLHFGRDPPRERVTAVVVTVINRTPEPLSDLELRCAAEPRSCRVKLQSPSATRLPAHSPFAPPSAVTQVMLLSNPRRESPVSLKYVLSYRTPDGEPHAEMGQVKELPA